jgi:RND family efflux transporter MFP subunit
MRVLSLATLACLAAGPAAAQTSFTVAPGMIADQKAVFATVESAHVVSARARLAGTVAQLNVQDGDAVTAGQVIATVVDPAMAEQLSAQDAAITGLRAQLAQANIDLARAQALITSGAISRSVLDQARTAQNVAASDLKSHIAARAALAQQIADGAVLAPVAGRVLLTPVTQGTVVMDGDTIATIAEQDFVLRLDVPERHAEYLQLGQPVRLDDDGTTQPEFGKITLIYPTIQNGQVEADASAANLGDYFVGQRIQVWLFAGLRPGLVIPAHFIETRFGLDYADVHNPDGSTIAVPVQRGEAQPTPALPDGVEILSGLQPGDVLTLPASAP